MTTQNTTRTEPSVSSEDARISANEGRQFLLSSLLDTISDHIYFKDENSRFLLISRSMASLFNLESPDLAIGKSDADFFASEHAAQALRDEQQIMSSGKGLVNQVERETWPNGSVSWVSTTKMPILAENGKPIGCFGISRDITEQVQAQLALQKSRDQVSAILSSTTDCFFALDLKQSITYANPAAEALLKVPSDALLGRCVLDVFSEDMAQTLSDVFEDAMSTREVCECEIYDEVGERWLVFRAFPSESTISVYCHDITLSKEKQKADDAQKRELEALVIERTCELTEANSNLKREITERQRAEAALVQTERLEAISVMASGMAVNFENIISVIAKYATSIHEASPPGSRIHGESKRVLEGVRRGGELTQRLMGVAQSDKAVAASPPEIVNVGAAIENVTRLLSDLLRKQNVSIRFKRVENMPHVYGHHDQLKDVLLEFIMNAAEAMGASGGTIRIDVQERSVAHPNTKRNPTSTSGDYAVIRVRDDGVGMSADVLTHIFEPFYTTKNDITSHGLGLAFARGAIQSMGGWIEARSRVSKGSSFRIFMPKADPPSKLAGRAGGEHVLILHQADPDRDMIANCLGEAGFDVRADIEVDSVRAALSPKAERVVDMIVIDAMHTSENLKRFLGEISQSLPQTKILLVSGFSRVFIGREAGGREWSFLQKPFDAKTLRKKVDAMFTPGDGAS
ncbi:MAG: PAS domain S-box-containing protein [Candidatus Promineifilaceae bacterium]|jgi:PAS domain S-box-containing protein